MKKFLTINEAVNMLVEVCYVGAKKIFIPGDGRYQPEALIPFLAYDQWARWLIIVEWFWMYVLAIIGVMPKKDAALLTPELLKLLLTKITTVKQDKAEYGNRAKGIKGTNHDIQALLKLMRRYLPKPLHRWLHYCATSYDIICTAYALQLAMTVKRVVLPELGGVDEIWRKLIGDNAAVLKMGKTHLQPALPITAGFEQAWYHHRFIESARRATEMATKVEIKFSGAVGTKASQKVLGVPEKGEKTLAKLLGLPAAKMSTQITPPESMARFYFELVLLSGALGNLGDDTRILQSPWFGEATSESAGSSAMSHKTSNPIRAENTCGMHVDALAEFSKVTMTLISNFQRDLRWSSVMRSYSAVLVYTFQQLLNAKRVLKSMVIEKGECIVGIERFGRLSPAEVLHLYLQREGLPEAHHFINKVIVPRARECQLNLYEAMERHLRDEKRSKKLKAIWLRLKKDPVAEVLKEPKKFIGNSIKIAQRETKNKL